MKLSTTGTLKISFTEYRMILESRSDKWSSLKMKLQDRAYIQRNGYAYIQPPFSIPMKLLHPKKKVYIWKGK
jgi:hypothetical protein